MRRPLERSRDVAELDDIGPDIRFGHLAASACGLSRQVGLGAGLIGLSIGDPSDDDFRSIPPEASAFSKIEILEYPGVPEKTLRVAAA